MQRTEWVQWTKTKGLNSRYVYIEKTHTKSIRRNAAEVAAAEAAVALTTKAQSTDVCHSMGMAKRNRYINSINSMKYVCIYLLSVGWMCFISCMLFDKRWERAKKNTHIESSTKKHPQCIEVNDRCTRCHLTLEPTMRKGKMIAQECAIQHHRTGARNRDRGRKSP